MMGIFTILTHPAHPETSEIGRRKLFLHTTHSLILIIFLLLLIFLLNQFDGDYLDFYPKLIQKYGGSQPDQVCHSMSSDYDFCGR